MKKLYKCLLILLLIISLFGCTSRYNYDNDYINRDYIYGSYDDNYYIGQKISGFIFKIIESSFWKNKYYDYREKYNISPEWTFKTSHIHINGDGELNIKGSGQFGFNTFIEIPKGSIINIGENVHFSKNIVIYSGRYNDSFFIETGKIKVINCTLNIGDNVFIYPFNHIDGGINISNNTIIKPFTYTK